MKFKKIISTVLATAMVFSLSAVTAFASEGLVPTEDGTYTSTMVEAYNYYTPDNYSMCNGVFAGEVDLTIEGDWATLNLYVCNPTPSWGGLETGVLSNAIISYDGVEYAGTLSSIGMTDENAAEKLFTQDASFFGIEAGTVYTVDTMEFVIPTEALASNIDISAFVNLVMNSKQSFWLDITFVEVVADDNGESDTDVNTTEKQEVTVYATVLANESTFTVTVPEEVSFGELSASVDTVIDYEVSVSNFVKGNDGALVEVTAGTGEITDGTNAIAFANNFGTQSASDNATFAGELTVKASDVSAAAAGDYTGTLTFEIRTVK